MLYFWVNVINIRVYVKADIDVNKAATVFPFSTQYFSYSNGCTKTKECLNCLVNITL